MMWLNGQLTERGVVAASGAGATLGWGVFTTLGIRNGSPCFVRRHFTRLERDARAAGVPWEIDFGTIEGALRAVLAAGRVCNGFARLTLTKRGEGRWNQEEGADLSVMATESPRLESPMRVQLSPFRVEARGPLCGVKTTSYLPYMWAWQQAKAQGFDEAILREGNDWLSEGARSTLFWAKNGALYTPSEATGCLRGIGRELTLEWAQTFNLEVRSGEFSATEAESAQEMWLVSAATGPRSVLSWHEENGARRAIFDIQGEIARAFAAWFHGQSE